ncbi:hydroxyisourate hydrolase [Abyssibius alkaniclasticus]|uniref:hydroxyisourate hydrolase n=1 Tax=Abyssibius alkaniclasticus TaxID=2881234 RepID=UPI00236333D1|nr:hydroxyisourate hydrolase [Abyssibius alkaniclasticus]UPH69966.1 hydroxyisourate hydrolase [Abyssibius alkaniclasticus]|tara:strand:- start:169 stop:522 length:354 start_codon:yes stop_codon:yes gene_type:complete
MAGLSTHVLDTARGAPAAGLKIELFADPGGARRPLGTFTTNADGRTDGLLIAPEDMASGSYELVFHVGDYLRAGGLVDDGELFLDIVPLRFGVRDPAQHYHVPLLVSPFAYSTYRGS